MQRISKIGVFQTSKVVGIIYFAISLIIVIPVLLISGITGMPSIARELGLGFMGNFVFIFIPVLYGFAGFITTTISCLAYNIIAKWTGGIELQLVEDYPEEY